MASAVCTSPSSSSVDNNQHVSEIPLGCTGEDFWRALEASPPYVRNFAKFCERAEMVASDAQYLLTVVLNNAAERDAISLEAPEAKQPPLSYQGEAAVLRLLSNSLGLLAESARRALEAPTCVDI